MFLHIHLPAAAAGAAAGLWSHSYDPREAFSIMKSPFMRQEIITHIHCLRFLLSIHFFV